MVRHIAYGLNMFSILSICYYNPIPTNKPGVEPKRPSRPVNITVDCVRLEPIISVYLGHQNVVGSNLAGSAEEGYSTAVYLVVRLSSSTLLSRLKSMGIKNPDHTRAMIKQKLQHDPDLEIATTSLRGSLLCPLGKMRMDIPCRSITCSHLQCIDASLYLQMNEKKPTWICPVCDKDAVFRCLMIDGISTTGTSSLPPVPSSLHTSLPLPDSISPEYYPPEADILTLSSNHVNYYPNLPDLYMILRGSESDQQFDSLFQEGPCSTSDVGSRLSITHPNIISLD
ncbi:E3 SUMO-protein ligase PIAS1-like isoform X2 [Tachypleus tridentatus]|uniref:E3 SUMO-protein ligase PIAS1-like isoform X2 n=1 Tax=Tachypleus tridentatus TaxID=6853 RepID=UPI003FD20182